MRTASNNITTQKAYTYRIGTQVQNQHNITMISRNLYYAIMSRSKPHSGGLPANQLAILNVDKEELYEQRMAGNKPLFRQLLGLIGTGILFLAVLGIQEALEEGLVSRLYSVYGYIFESEDKIHNTTKKQPADVLEFLGAEVRHAEADFAISNALTYAFVAKFMPRLRFEAQYKDAENLSPAEIAELLLAVNAQLSGSGFSASIPDCVIHLPILDDGESAFWGRSKKSNDKIFAVRGEDKPFEFPRHQTDRQFEQLVGTRVLTFILIQPESSSSNSTL